MKLHQYGLLFCAIGAALLCMLRIRTNLFQAVVEEQRILDRCFERAVDDSVNSLIQSVDERTIRYSKEEAFEHFCSSLYSSLGVTTQPVVKERLFWYIPFFIVTDTDGFYIYYSEVIVKNGTKTMVKQWSEKFPYYYEDEFFIYRFTFGNIVTLYDKKGILEGKENGTVETIDFHEAMEHQMFAGFRSQADSCHFMLDEKQYQRFKQSTIIRILEEKMQFYIEQHNDIAKQFGINYHFMLPAMDQSDYMRAITSPGIMVLFQGYPLYDGRELYHRFDVAGAKINKTEPYFIETKDWYQVYHRQSCPLVQSKKVNIDQNVPYYCEKEAVEQGAYACEICVSESVHVPHNQKRDK